MFLRANEVMHLKDSTKFQTHCSHLADIGVAELGQFCSQRKDGGGAPTRSLCASLEKSRSFALWKYLLRLQLTLEAQRGFTGLCRSNFQEII